MLRWRVTTTNVRRGQRNLHEESPPVSNWRCADSAVRHRPLDGVPLVGPELGGRYGDDAVTLPDPGSQPKLLGLLRRVRAECQRIPPTCGNSRVGIGRPFGAGPAAHARYGVGAPALFCRAYRFE